MLYILPPPSAKPPSVWDLIINFHRKGCQESAGSSSTPKKLLKFDCRETTKKSQRTWCKTSPSDQSHVSIYRRRDLKKNNMKERTTTIRDQFHFLAAKKISSTFPPKTRLRFPSRRRFVAGNGKKRKKFSPIHTWQNGFGDLKIVFFHFSAFHLHFELRWKTFRRRFFHEIFLRKSKSLVEGAEKFLRFFRFTES